MLLSTHWPHSFFIYSGLYIFCKVLKKKRNGQISEGKYDDNIAFSVYL